MLQRDPAHNLCSKASQASRASAPSTTGLVSSLTIALAVAMMFVGGCAGKNVSKVELPSELPQELQTKFEVRDTPVPVPSATPAVTLTAVDQAALTKTSLKRKHKITKAEAKKLAAAQVKAGPQYPNRRPTKDPIWVGEKFLFEITYFGMAAGDFTVEVGPFKAIQDRKVYHIQAHAESSSVFSMFYRLNDSIESFIDYEGIFSHRFHLILDETKQSRDALELYDYDKLRTFYWNKWNHRDRGYSESKEYGDIPPWSQDSVSALYYVRTLPLKDGDVYTFPVVSEGKPWEAVVTVLRREIVDSPMGKVQAIVVKPETKFRGVLQKRGDSFIWLTDDDRRIPIRLEAKVKIGTVVGSLKQVVSYGNAPQPDAAPSPTASP
jgi:Protein of unknown function (DUF3108)